MTPERDIDHVLEAWLTPGPSEMPDRVYLGVLDRIERVPQRRSARLQLRFQTMIPTFRLVAVGVFALTVGVAIAPFLAGSNQTTTSPDPSASTTPSGVLVPTELQGKWVTDFRVIDGLRNDSARAVSLTFMPGQLETGSGANNGLKSHAILQPDGLLRLDTLLAATGCDVGEVGTYTWSIGEGLPRFLTITPVADDCALRAEVMNGTFRATACNHDNNWTCQDIDKAGSYESIAFEPRLARTDPERWRPGGVSFTVPVGWVNPYDSHDEFQLVSPETSHLMKDQPDDSPAQIWVEGRPAALVATSICDRKLDPATGRSASDLVAFVRNHPGLTVSEPAAVTIGGHPGTQLDIDVAPSWTERCKDWEGSSPVVPLFGFGVGSSADASTPVGPWGGLGGRKDHSSDPVRIIIVDLGGGDVAMVWVASGRSDDPTRDDAKGQAAFVAEAKPIVDSLHFAD